MVELRVLGELEVIGDGGVVPIGARKLRQLLEALAIGAGETRSVDWLIDALWGDAAPASADKLLQVYVSRLRKLLPDGVQIVTRGTGYALGLEAGAHDATRFERLAGEGRRALGDGTPALAGSLLRRGLALWRGPAFGELADLPAARLEAARLEELRLGALEDRIDADLAGADAAELVAECCALAEAHPLRERLQAQAMLCLYRTGRHPEALARFARLRERLDDELGLLPGPEVSALQQRILSHDPSLARPPRRALSCELPAPATPLIGRERELSELTELIGDDAIRLVVLTGAGGSGKTRLAIEAARRNAGRFADGASLVVLAAVRDPQRVPAEIAAAVGLQERAGIRPEQLVEFLSGRELLLVVDNVEHLLDAVEVFVMILQRAPRVTLLVTSRAVLHLSGEHVYPVRPLAAADAAALFLARARAANPALRIGPADGDLVARICARLDRLPLALELAAGRARVMSARELLSGLEPRLPMLTGGPRDLPARQQTMAGAIGWSEALLGASARDEFRRLGVFAAGCTIEAAGAVCQSTMPSLAALVDDNLLQCTVDDDRSRFSMLETVREYALRQLHAAGEHDAIADRHLRYFAALAQRCHLFAEAEEPQDFDTANREQENLRAAITWAREHGRARDALLIAVALENFWVTHDPDEGARLLAELLADDDASASPLAVRALRAQASSRHVMGELAVADSLYRVSREQLRRQRDEKGVAILDYRLGLAAVQRGDVAEGAELLQSSLGVFTRIGSRRGEAQAIGALGRVARARGDHVTAARRFAQSAEMCEQIGRPWWQALMLAEAAELALIDGDLRSACARATRLLALATHIGDRPRTLLGLGFLACVAAREGQPARAVRLGGALQGELDGGARSVLGPYGSHIGRRVAAAEALSGTVRLPVPEAIDEALGPRSSAY